MESVSGSRLYSHLCCLVCQADAGGVIWARGDRGTVIATKRVVGSPAHDRNHDANAPGHAKIAK